MCHMRKVWVVYDGCGHTYNAPGTPGGEGELIDCGKTDCRVSSEHPSWCQGQVCVDRGCFTYRTQPQNYIAKRYPEKCPYTSH